jgi:hypothetical protein
MNRINKIKKWREFLLESVTEFKYYIFDWDDNILIMETPLHFQHFENGKWVNIDISPSEFAQIRKKYPSNYMDNTEWKGDPKYSFIEFRDFGPRGTNAFIDDVKKTIKDKKFGPSWEVFIDTLREGRLFAIVTTRGHEPATLRSAVKYIIENVLTPEDKAEMEKNLQKFNDIFGVKTVNLVDQYLNECYFMGMFSQAFQDEFQYNPAGPKLNQGKQDAINKFVNFVRDFSQRTKKPFKVGFSDDDVNFSAAAKELFMKLEKSLDFPENFYVFDTSNPNIKGGVKVKI